MRPSMKLCCSRAAWYSAFSLRSPCARASAIALMTFGRASLFSFIQLHPQPLGAAKSHRGSLPAGNSLCKSCSRFTSMSPRWSSAVAGRACRGHRRVVGDLSRHGLAPNGARFTHRLLALGGIDDQRHLVVFYHIDDVGATLAHLVDAPAFHARFTPRSPALVPPVAAISKPRASSIAAMRELHRTRFVAVLAHALMKHRPARPRQHHPGCRLGLGVSLTEGASRAHHFSRGFHLRSQDGIGLRENLMKGNTASFDREVRRNAFLRSALLRWRAWCRSHDSCRHLRERNAGGLGYV